MTALLDCQPRISCSKSTLMPDSVLLGGVSRKSYRSRIRSNGDLLLIGDNSPPRPPDLLTSPKVCPANLASHYGLPWYLVGTGIAQRDVEDGVISTGCIQVWTFTCVLGEGGPHVVSSGEPVGQTLRHTLSLHVLPRTRSLLLLTTAEYSAGGGLCVARCRASLLQRRR